MRVCNDCPRQCNAIREDYSGKGYCKEGNLPKVAKACLHFWEEPCISGKNGSGAVFFSGCSLKCVFCQNYEISNKQKGKIISIEELTKIYKKLEDMGANNINLVNPTHFSAAILESFERYKPRVPVIYNTGGYDRVETIKKFDRKIDVYLPDLKYIDSEKSKRYSKVEDYFNYAFKAIEEMVKQTGKAVFDDNGIIKKGTIVRHLILPSNTNESIKILDLLDSNFGDDILVSLMCQYIPVANAGKYDEINRKLTSREYEKVQEHLFSLELDGFVQELSAADERYIPDFNGDIL